MSVICFLERIREALRPIGATVDWLIVFPLRRTYIHHSAHPRTFEEVLHSVFAITTADREQYVADFTIEQFGYSAADWFTLS
jgi:hypothetical protein